VPFVSKGVHRNVVDLALTPLWKLLFETREYSGFTGRFQGAITIDGVSHYVSIEFLNGRPVAAEVIAPPDKKYLGDEAWRFIVNAASSSELEGFLEMVELTPTEVNIDLDYNSKAKLSSEVTRTPRVRGELPTIRREEDRGKITSRLKALQMLLRRSRRREEKEEKAPTEAPVEEAPPLRREVLEEAAKEEVEEVFAEAREALAFKPPESILKHLDLDSQSLPLKDFIKRSMLNVESDVLDLAELEVTEKLAGEVEPMLLREIEEAGDKCLWVLLKRDDGAEGYLLFCGKVVFAAYCKIDGEELLGEEAYEAVFSEKFFKLSSNVEVIFKVIKRSKVKEIAGF